MCLYKPFCFRWTVKKEHRVADIADVVVTRLRKIAKSVTLKEIEEPLHDLRVWSIYTSRLKAMYG